MSQEKNCLQCHHDHWSLTGEFGNARKIMDEHIRRAPTCQDFQE